MKKSEIRELLENSVTALKVFNRLNEIEPNLSKYFIEGSVIAGGSVSNIFMHIINNDFPEIVNDIDVFMHETISVSKSLSKSDNDFNMNEYKATATYSISAVSNDGVINVIDYVYLHSMIFGDYMYNNFYPFRKYDNKEIYLFLAKKNAYEIISFFDINAVQLALIYHNNTPHLIYTEDFLNFAYSLQLEIVNYMSPVSTAFRVMKKSKQLPVYVNYYREYEKISYVLYANAVADSKDNILITPFILNKYKDYIDDIRQYFNIHLTYLSFFKIGHILVPKHFNKDSASHYINVLKASGYNRSVNILTDPITVRLEDSAIINVMKNYGYTNQHRAYLTEHAQYKGIGGLLRRDFMNFYKPYNKRELGLLKIIAQHSNDFSFYCLHHYSSDSIISLLSFLKKQAKRYGEIVYGWLSDKEIRKAVSNMLYYRTIGDTLGIVEQHEQIFIKRVEKKISAEYEKLIDKFDISDFVIPAGYKGADINELLSNIDLKAEGAAMHHCVGGYDHALRRGERIFSIKYNNKRSTAHLRKNNSVGIVPRWTIVQHRSYSNANPDTDLISIVQLLISHMNKKEYEKYRKEQLYYVDSLATQPSTSIASLNTASA